MRGQISLHKTVALSVFTGLVSLCVARSTMSLPETILAYVFIALVPQLLILYRLIHNSVHRYKVYQEAKGDERRKEQLKRPQRKRKTYIPVYCVPLRQLMNAVGIHSTRAGPMVIAA